MKYKKTKNIKIKPLIAGIVICFLIAYLQYADYLYMQKDIVGSYTTIGRYGSYLMYFIILVMSIMVISYGLSINSKFATFGKRIYEYFTKAILDFFRGLKEEWFSKKT